MRCFVVSCANYWWPRRKDEVFRANASLVTNSQWAKQSHLKSDQAYEPPRLIHILGVGNVGAFVAHSLAGIPNRPPINLLFRSKGRIRRWEEHGRCLQITTHGVPVTRSGFDVEALQSTELDPLPEMDARSEHDGALSTEKGPGDISTMPDQTLIDIHETLALEEATPSGSHMSGASLTSRQAPNIPSVQKRGVSGTEATLSTPDNLTNTNPQSEDEHSGESETASGMVEDIIHNLIVTVKAPQTCRALQALTHRLTEESTILFLQNGMGIIDEVNEKVFPDEKTRPTYIIGVISHGLWSDREFDVVHAGQGTIALGVMPRSYTSRLRLDQYLSDASPSSRYLIRTMTRTPVFVAVGFPPADMLQQQLDKLAVNAIINPLTAILDCKNGALLSNFHFTRVMRLLLAEISIVVQSLPELQNVPNVKTRFDTARLERLVVSIANATFQNSSSMLQDVRNGWATEINYISGYIVRRGEELGIQCAMNYMVMHMVQGKSKTMLREKENLLPLQHNVRRQ